MKNSSKRMIGCVILALVLVTLLVPTAFASYSSCFLNYGQTSAQTSVVGSSSIVNCSILGYNDVLSESGMYCYAYAGGSSSGGSTVLYSSGWINPNQYYSVPLYGWSYCKTKLYNSPADDSSAIGYAYDYIH